MELDQQLLETVYTPDSLMTALTKIGAVVALSKVFVFFSLMHEYRFEKKLEKETRLQMMEGRA